MFGLPLLLPPISPAPRWRLTGLPGDPAFRLRRNADRSRLQPHQGKRERARRQRQLAKALGFVWPWHREAALAGLGVKPAVKQQSARPTS